MDEDRMFTSVERGVYELPFCDRDGKLRLMAISRRGRIVAEVSVPRCGLAVTVEALHIVLDDADPEPHLELMA